MVNSSLVFVLVQFAAIGALLLTGPWLPQPPALLALLAAGLGLGAWAILSMGIGNFGASPVPLPVRSRRYDDKFWQELLGDKATGSKSEKQLKKELGF